MSKRFSPGRLAALGAAAALVGAIALAVWRLRQPAVGPSAPVALTYVGSEACAACHSTETTAWRESQHTAAMTEASAATVLGRFDGAEFNQPGEHAAFFQRTGRFYVRTDGPDGRPADFPLEYTFGISPLQQYLIRLPAGRLQVFGVAWDTRPAARGGQRWMDLYPRETLKAGDPLHWTGLQQNWNFMCADCHSTRVQKGYNSETREFHTSWSEISVGCEACHGPGSAHAAMARRSTHDPSDYGLTVRFDERQGVSWTTGASIGHPTRSRPRTTDREIEVCARCHSRRSQITDRWKPGDPLEDGFRPSLIEPALFYSDGQQKEEVYDYTSFLQSRMYVKGVTCADCHEPHGGKLRFAGNGLCTQCHQASTYDAPAHHFHRQGAEGSACAACHMPAATFMQIDTRHDHSFRVPRPDRSVTIGVPNSCTATCHSTRTAEWAAREIQRRIGRPPGGYQTFAEAFAAADRGETGASEKLRQLAIDSGQPPIVRASALERLAAVAVDPGGDAIAGALRDPSPMVRRAALSALAHSDPAERVRAGANLLADPIRTVRIQAAVCFADVADRFLSGRPRAAFDAAFAEFLAEQQFNADRPEAQTTLGTVWLARGQAAPAVSAFQEAIRLDRTFVPAHVNLADALQSQGNEAGAERALRDGLAVAPANAALHHSLGLSLVRQRRMPEALAELSQAVRLDPEAARFSYAYGIALHDTGSVPEALNVLRASLRKHPKDRDTLLVLAEYAREAGRIAEARGYVTRLLSLDPSDAEARDLAAKIGK